MPSTTFPLGRRQARRAPSTGCALVAGGETSHKRRRRDADGGIPAWHKWWGPCGFCGNDQRKTGGCVSMAFCAYVDFEDAESSDAAAPLSITVAAVMELSRDTVRWRSGHDGPRFGCAENATGAMRTRVADAAGPARGDSRVLAGSEVEGAGGVCAFVMG